MNSGWKNVSLCSRWICVPRLLSLKCIPLKGVQSVRRGNNIYYPWISECITIDSRGKPRDKIDRRSYILRVCYNDNFSINKFHRCSGYDFWLVQRVNRRLEILQRQWETRETVGFIEPLRVRESLTRWVLWKRCRCTHHEFIRRDILILVLDQIIKTFRPPLASSTMTFSFLVLL